MSYKKILFVIAAVILAILPTAASATPVSWDQTSGILQPLISGQTSQVKVPYLTATSTTATSTLNNTNLAGPTVEILGQYITNLVTYIRSLFSGGTGISVSGGTITNTGVTSIVAGTNVSISGSTGAVTINSTATGGSGTGNVATSTGETAGNLAYYTSTNGTPATIGKVATTSLGVSAPITFSGTLGAQVGGVSGTFGCTTATGSVAGCLSAADWTTFNGKGSGTVTSVAGNNGLTGTVTTTGNIGLATIAANSVLGNISGSSAVPTAVATSSLFNNASATQSGLLTSTDWNTFNGKQATISFGTGVQTWIGTPSSANLATAVTDETGSGLLVFGTSPTLVTPILGTPTSVTLTNATGLPIGGITGLGTGIGTWLATPSSANLAAALTDESGTGAAIFAGSPTFTGTINGASMILNASTTIGGGTNATGLTINGGATTTGNAVFSSNIGVGTSSPTDKLDLFIGADYAAHAQQNAFAIASSSGGTATTSLFHVDTFGNTVVGSLATPAFASAAGSGFAVSGQSLFNNNVFVTNSAGLWFNAVNGFTNGIQPYSDGVGNGINFVPTTALGGGAQSRFYLSHTGLVGIGTSSPSARLSISLNSGDVMPGNNAFQVSSSTASATTTLFNISNTGSTTIANGVNITAGCYAVNGTCLGTGVSLSANNTWTGTQTFGNASSTLFTITGQGWASLFEGTYYAENYSGSDIGAKVNTAYAAGPSTGVHVHISGTGTLAFSTAMSFTTSGKPIWLTCDPGVTLNYTGSATSTVVNETNVSGGQFPQQHGESGCNLIHTNTGAGDTSVGVEVGGTNGAPNVQLNNMHIMGFGKGVVTGNNLWLPTFSNDVIEYNTRAFDSQGTTNAGEQFRFDNDNISDCVTVNNCINFNTGTIASAVMNGVSLDDGSMYIGGGSLDVTLNNMHLEAPNWAGLAAYTPIVIANDTFTHVNITGGIAVISATGTGHSFPQVILNGSRDLELSGMTFQNNGGATTLGAAVNNYGAGSLQYYGLLQVGNSTALSTVATSSVVWGVNEQGIGHAQGTIVNSLPFDGLSINAASCNEDAQNCGFGIFDLGKNNYIQSAADPIITTSNGGYANWPLMIQNPNSNNASSTGIGFAVSNEVAVSGLADGVFGGGIGFQRIGGGSYGDIFGMTTDNNNIAHEVFRATNDRKFAIGTTTPRATLTVVGQTGYDLLQLASSTRNNIFNIYSTGQMQMGGLLPTAATSTGSGTGSVPISIQGNSNDFNFTLTTGLTPTGSNAIIATFTMPSACPTGTIPMFSDANVNTDALAVVAVPYASSTDSSHFNFVSGTTALGASTLYKWNFHVGCY